MKKSFLFVAVAAVLVTGIVWGVQPAYGDDTHHSPATTSCTQNLCTHGSTACCPSSAHGTWNASRHTCTCPAATHSTSGQHVRASVDSDPPRDAGTGDAHANPDAGTSGHGH
jgi:hypothetical protein